MVPMQAGPLFDVLTREILTQTRVCDEFLGFCNSPKVTTLEIDDYSARVLADKPAEILNDDYQSKLYAEILSDLKPRETFTILHLSDIHIDQEYEIGSLWDCDGYLCCRAENGFPTDPAKAAGKWGGYKCDLPLRTFQHMLNHIIEAHGDEIQSVFWTGDNSPHDTWDNTED